MVCEVDQSSSRRLPQVLAYLFTEESSDDDEDQLQTTPPGRRPYHKSMVEYDHHTTRPSLSRIDRGGAEDLARVLEERATVLNLSWEEKFMAERDRAAKRWHRWPAKFRAKNVRTVENSLILEGIAQGYRL